MKGADCMSIRHESQIDELIGKKVAIHLEVEKKVERVLRRDSDGLYIKFQNERVSVSLEQIQEVREIKMLVADQHSDQKNIIEETRQSGIQKQSNVIPVQKFYQLHFRNVVQKKRNPRQLRNVVGSFPGMILPMFEKPP
jgi:hypothetical protein